MLGDRFTPSLVEQRMRVKATGETVTLTGHRWWNGDETYFYGVEESYDLYTGEELERIGGING